MNDFLKMDVFFVVSTAAVVVVSLLLSYALYRLIRILHRLERISESVSAEADLIRADIAEARTSVRREGYRFLALLSAARLVAERMLKRKPRKGSER